MAFVDTLLTESKASVVLVDERAKPGGHWNDAYSFVRLHQPSSFYGVPSQPLGSGRLELVGTNAGLHELSSKCEILDYFDKVLHRTFLPSGRVTWLPLSRYEQTEDGKHLVRSLLNGTIQQVTAGRLVDSTTAKVEVPATRPPTYGFGGDITVVPVNGLPAIRRPFDAYTVVGAGKTGMDACLWLLEHGVPPSVIRWIVPNDPWMMPRETVDTLETAMSSTIASFEQASSSRDLTGLLQALERCGSLVRLDPDVWPTAYRCAVVSRAELHLLRQIKDVVRLGRLQAIAKDRLSLDHGEVTARPDTLYVDCSASALQRTSPRPVFEPGRISLQFVRWCQPLFSAALIAFVECHLQEDGRRNALCRPVRLPREPVDWLRMWQETMANMAAWRSEPALSAWMAKCRLVSAQPGSIEEEQRHRALAKQLRAAMTNAAPAIHRMLA